MLPFGNVFILGLVKHRRLQWTEHVAKMGETRNAYKILVGISLAGPKRRTKYDIRLHLKKI